MLSRADQPRTKRRAGNRARVRSQLFIMIGIMVLGPAAGASAAQEAKADAGTKIVLKGHEVTDFGQLRPGEPAQAYFFIGVRSSAPYREKFSWTDFSRTGQAIPADRLRLSVGSNNTTAPVENGGTHPAETVEPHPPSVNIKWEKVNLLLRLLWPDPPGRYQGELTIEVMVI